MYLRRTLAFLVVLMGMLLMTITSMAGEFVSISDDEISLAFESEQKSEETGKNDIEKENVKISAMWQIASLTPDIHMPEEVALKLGESVGLEEDTDKVDETESLEKIEETEVSTEPAETVVPEEDEHEEKVPEETEFVWDGPVLNSYNGTVEGPSGKETYYNLPMSYVVELMHNAGFEGEYWVREDGVKMFGDYIMVAADLSHRPKGTILPTSLGMAMVCDTGAFVKWNSYQIDIAVAW